MDPKVLREVRTSAHPSMRRARSGGAEVAESSHPGARCNGETLLLTITDIAARVGAEVSLIEYLQRKGILGTQQKPGVYPEEALLRVRWALAGNSLGLDLLHVRAFIELCSHGNKEAFDGYLKDRIIEVDLRLKELRTTRAALEALSYDHPGAIRSSAGAARSVEAQPSWRSV